MESAYKELTIYYIDGHIDSKSIEESILHDFEKWYKANSEEKFCLEEPVQEILDAVDASAGVFLERKEIKSYEISNEPKFDDVKLVF